MVNEENNNNKVVFIQLSQCVKAFSNRLLFSGRMVPSLNCADAGGDLDSRTICSWMCSLDCYGKIYKDGRQKINCFPNVLISR